MQVASRRRDHPTFWPVLTGILGIIAGALAFVNPAATAWALSILVGGWAIVLGVLEVVGAVELGKDHTVAQGMRYLLGLFGIGAVLLGIAIFIKPEIGGITLVSFLGFNALLIGAGSILLGWNIRRRSREQVSRDYYDEQQRKRAA
jgi:uncharacterized membrane protein HdeD (DUF308 family)